MRKSQFSDLFWHPGLVFHPYLFLKIRSKSLQLGCGCGVTGMALHFSGAKSSFLTDGDENTVLNAGLNLRILGLDSAAVSAEEDETKLQLGELNVMQLQWEKKPPQWLKPDVSFSFFIHFFNHFIHFFPFISQVSHPEPLQDVDFHAPL